MTIFSKPLNHVNSHNNIIKEKKIKKIYVDNNLNILTYKEYFDNKINLKKYKLPELKIIIKYYNLTRTGKKNVLIERIEKHFNDIHNSIIIQKIFRGWIVRYSFKLRGNALKNRKICVNDTDFITLEPIIEIPYEYFFSYKDNSDFTYGFNILSLIQCMKTKNKLVNPYNRDIIERKILNNIISLYKITKLIYSNFNNDVLESNNKTECNNNNVNNNHNNVSQNVSQLYYHPRITNIISSNTELSNELRMKYNKIVDIRSKPVDVRINELFIEIDRLGNYSQSSWFSSLIRVEYIRLYRYMYDIWNYRGQLSSELKTNICPLFDPFQNVFMRNVHHSEFTIDDLRIGCLTVFENMVYTGINDEYRKIGALHVLSTLTLVSYDASRALPWLFESVSL